MRLAAAADAYAGVCVKVWTLLGALQTPSKRLEKRLQVALIRIPVQAPAHQQMFRCLLTSADERLLIRS